MSFDRGVFQCDSCPDYLDTDEHDLMVAIVIAKKKGWRAYRGPDQEWAHSCPSCREDYAKKHARS